MHLWPHKHTQIRSHMCVLPWSNGSAWPNRPTANEHKQVIVIQFHPARKPASAVSSKDLWPFRKARGCTGVCHTWFSVQLQQHQHFLCLSRLASVCPILTLMWRKDWSLTTCTKFGSSMHQQLFHIYDGCVQRTGECSISNDANQHSR